ncbi:hypothetical protein DH2020_016078 [Rehmannia glutinosa]|uniref:Protein tweety homolog n=1 Tax=Rehmannia glutinosa TaxID=99300 RepID=A0ABR0WUZ5_REHGL
MSRSSENAIPFVLLLVSISPFTENSLVFGSSVSEQIAKRPDPFRKFRNYGGDYDIRNKHYWASAAFTGIHGYAVAGIWVVCGVGFGVFIVVKNLSGSTSPVVDHPKSSNLIVFWLLVLFTIFAIAGSSVTIAATEKCHERAENLEKTIFGAADNVSRTIGKVKATLQQMQTLLLPYDSKTCHLLNVTSHRLRVLSLNIQNFVRHNRKSLDRAIQTLYVVNLVVLSINLVLLVAGLVLLTLQFRPGIIVLIFSCWILTTLSWILTGVDFFFHTFIGDTCATLKNFEEDPQKNSLTEILPCPKSTDYGKTLQQINYSVHSFISEINSKVEEVLDLNEQNEDPQLPEICDPFSSAPNYSYSPQNCGKNSIPIGDLPSVLSRFICYATNTSESCQTDGRFLPEAIYTVSLAYSQSIQDFINIYPDLSSLMKCSPVKQAFSEIISKQCSPIELSTKELWASMLSLSLVMLILVLLWIHKAVRDKGRSFCRWSIFRPRPVQGS